MHSLLIVVGLTACLSRHCVYYSKFYSTRSKVKLIVLLYYPCESRQVFWPMLCPAGDGFIKEVVGVSDLPTNKHNYMYIPGKGKRSVFDNIYLPFRMLALRLNSVMV